MTGEQLREIVRGYVESLIERHAGGNQNQFCRDTEIRQPDLNRAMNKKSARGITWNQLARIGATARGYPSASVIFGELSLLIAAAETRAVISQRKEAGVELAKVIDTKTRGRVSKEAAEALRELQETEEKRPGRGNEKRAGHPSAGTPTRRP